MPASDRSIDALTFVTDHFRDILRRRLSELAGLALVTLALLGAIALATWSVQDPSLSHATQKPIHNLLGFPGAIFSDLAMQLLGLAAVLLLAPLALYGWRLLSHRPLGERWRGLTFIVAIFVTAAFVSTLPRIGTWPLPTGLGGVCGDALLMLPALFIPLSGFSLLIVSLISGVAAALTLALAIGMRWPQARAAATDEMDDEDEAEADDSQESEEPDRASPWLGMLVHALLSLKARLVLVFRGTARPERTPAASGPRVEPRFTAGGRINAPSIAPEPDYDEEIEDDEEEAPQPAPRRRAAAPRAPARRSTQGFTLPSLNLLAAQKASERTTLSKDVIDSNAAALETVLGDFGVRGEIINARPGPVVTLYELEPAPGIKSSRVIGLADDIARSMSAVSARVAVVSGRNAIGIELPN